MAPLPSHVLAMSLSTIRLLFAWLRVPCRDAWTMAAVGLLGRTKSQFTLYETRVRDGVSFGPLDNFEKRGVSTGCQRWYPSHFPRPPMLLFLALSYLITAN